MDEGEVLQILGELPVATVYEAAGGLGDMGPEIRAMVPGARMAGLAWTVKTWFGDTTPVLRALDDAPPGSVIVVDAGNTGAASVWGGTSARACAARGLAGCVTNGLVRDTVELAAVGVPVFAAGSAPRGTAKLHPGWTNVPVAVGGVPVMPGDIVLGDPDGVLVVPRARAAEIAEAALRQRDKEAERDRRISAGARFRDLMDLPREAVR